MRMAPCASRLLGVLAFLSTLPLDALAQGSERVSGGFSIGANEARFANPDLVEWSPGSGFRSVQSNPGRRIGIRLSGFMEFAMLARFALRVEAAYSVVGMDYQGVHTGRPIAGKDVVIRLAYVEIPALAKLTILDTEEGLALSLFAGPALARKVGEEYGTIAFDLAGPIRYYRDDQARDSDLRFVVGAEGRIGIAGTALVIDVRFAGGLRKVWNNDGVTFNAPEAKNRVFSMSAGIVLF